MLEELANVFGNPHFEAYVAGPLIGTIFACIFATLGTRPPSGGKESRLSPQDAREQIEDYRDQRRRNNVRDVHHHHYHRDGSKSSDDGSPIFIAMGIALLVAMFLFAAFLPQIAFALNCFISGVAMFSMTTSLLAWLTGQFNTVDWWRHSIFPFVVSVGCFWITVQANQAISPDVVVFAQRLLGDNPMSVSLVISGSFKFFRVLGNEYVHWMIFDMLAFVCISVCAMVTLLQCVYYVALSNTRSSGGAGWQTLTLWTERFSGTGTVVFVSVLLVAGWFLATGGMYRLIH
jgi:hypothetical protein